MQQAILTEFIYPILLKNIGTTIDRVAVNQQDTNAVLGDICKAIQNIDFEYLIKHDITDGASIKRRLQRIKIMVGNYTGPNSYDDIIKEWEHCVQNNLKMTRTELFQSIEPRRRNKTVFDVMDEIPEFRKIGVDILVAFERKYNIPPALYSVGQVKQIGELRRTFDHSVVRCMNEQEFGYWVSDRYMEINGMLDGYKEPNQYYGNYGRYKLYWMFAMRHPELIPEQQIKYLSEMELVNMCNRAINDIKAEDSNFQSNYSRFFPLSDRKHDTKLLKDSFIDIILRCLIA